MPWLILFFIFATLLSNKACAELPTNSLPAEFLTNSPLKKIDAGIFEIGKVRFDSDKRIITLPAVVNMDKGPVEYLLVSSIGKLHESVLCTDVEPVHIHLAALLLGVKGAQTNLTVQDFNTKKIPGEEIHLWVKWKSKDQEKKVRAEDFILNTQSKSAMEQGNWTYNGSQLSDGTFIAQRDGLIVSIISDPLTLINNPRPGRDNDEIWQVNTNIIPPLNTAVEITIQLKNK